MAWAKGLGPIRSHPLDFASDNDESDSDSENADGGVLLAASGAGSNEAIMTRQKKLSKFEAAQNKKLLIHIEETARDQEQSSATSTPSIPSESTVSAPVVQGMRSSILQIGKQS